MKKKSFSRRFLSPVLAVFVLMAVSFIVYDYAPHITNHMLHQVSAGIAGFVLFLCIWFGTFYVYIASYNRGASLRERVFASLINPFIFATKEVIRVSESFTLLESLYFYLSLLSIGVFCVSIAEMGLSEILLRWRRKKQGENIRIISVPALLCFLAGISIVAFVFAWGQGEYSFYIFLRGFRKLFGPGIGV